MGMRLQGMGISGSSIDRMTLTASKSKAQGCPLFFGNPGARSPAHLEPQRGVQQGPGVEAGSFQGDAQSKGRREITLTRPAILDFRWKTAVEGAKQEFWQLIGPGPSRGQPHAVLAS